jgi:DNA-binding transcriptional regulator YiaG
MPTTDLELLIEARRAARTGSGVALREVAGLSQGELARAAGINPATLSRWESRERKPTGPAAIRYARVLRVLRSRLAPETREAVAMGAGP